MVITSTLGFTYWWVAARFFPTSAVGLASATTSSMMLLSTFCLLGLGTLLITEIPRNEGQAGPLISTGILLVGGVSFVVGLAFAVLTPFISPSLRPIGANITSILLFATSVSATAVTVIADQVLIALLKGGSQFWRNTVFSVVKLGALYLVGLWLSDKIGLTIYATWTLGNLVSLIPLLGAALWKNRHKMSNFLPQKQLLRKMGPAAFQHHILNLIIQAPSQILPVLVTILLSTSMTAWFYVASMIANFVFSISLSLTTVLHATNAAETTTLSQKARLTIFIGTVTSLVTNIILLVGASTVLNFFGHSYAQEAALPLRLLSLGAFPLIIKNHYIAIRRIKDEITNAMIPIMLGSLFELVLAAVGAHVGALVGLSLGWIIALCFEAIFMVRLVYRTVSGKDRASEDFSSIMDTNTLILAAVRPGIFTDSLSQIIDAPTQEMQAIIGLSSHLRAVKRPPMTIIDTPTVKLQNPEVDQQVTMRLPRATNGNKPYRRTHVLKYTTSMFKAQAKRPLVQPPEAFPVDVPDRSNEPYPSTK